MTTVNRYRLLGQLHSGTAQSQAILCQYPGGGRLFICFAVSNRGFVFRLGTRNDSREQMIEAPSFAATGRDRPKPGDPHEWGDGLIRAFARSLQEGTVDIPNKERIY